MDWFPALTGGYFGKNMHIPTKLLSHCPISNHFHLLTKSTRSNFIFSLPQRFCIGATIVLLP
jgi:hypothetical protein